MLSTTELRSSLFSQRDNTLQHRRNLFPTEIQKHKRLLKCVHGELAELSTVRSPSPSQIKQEEKNRKIDDLVMDLIGALNCSHVGTKQYQNKFSARISQDSCSSHRKYTIIGENVGYNLLKIASMYRQLISLPMSPISSTTKRVFSTKTNNLNVLYLTLYLSVDRLQL